MQPERLGEEDGHLAFRGLVARAAAQFPVWEDLNGIQDIKPAFSAGLTYVF